ncbi:hypothetical protein PPROV_000562500 [Pycnococcus provasolii]|uniref:Uncharacterized protein n=1 Tax=Pycnococcus provasolii TaxID=41880 RepID=A0A830HMW2_9CHLO|nr:hypothetical protein PPROV_000562500 [Pycnococcus provasolii]
MMNKSMVGQIAASKSPRSRILLRKWTSHPRCWYLELLEVEMEVVTSGEHTLRVNDAAVEHQSRGASRGVAVDAKVPLASFERRRLARSALPPREGHAASWEQAEVVVAGT